MRADRIAFFDKPVANLASEHVLLNRFFAEFLRLPVLGTEHRDVAGEIETFQRKFGLNGVLKGLREVFGRIQDTAVINVGDVHVEHVSGQLCLRCFDGNASLSSHAANRHFGDSTQQCITWCIAWGRAERTRHDVRCWIGAVARSAEVGRKFTTAEVGQHRRGGGLVHRQPLTSTFILDGPFSLSEAIHHGVGRRVRRVLCNLCPTGSHRRDVVCCGEGSAGN